MPLYDYECLNGHEYEKSLSLSEYDKKTKCPTCGKAGKKVIKQRQTEPGFSDTIYPLWDKVNNVIFNSASDRKRWMKEKGYESKEDSMTRSQESLLRSWKVGKFDPRLARYAKHFN